MKAEEVVFGRGDGCDLFAENTTQSSNRGNEKSSEKRAEAGGGAVCCGEQWRLASRFVSPLFLPGLFASVEKVGRRGGHPFFFLPR